MTRGGPVHCNLFCSKYVKVREAVGVSISYLGQVTCSRRYLAREATEVNVAWRTPAKTDELKTLTDHPCTCPQVDCMFQCSLT